MRWVRHFYSVLSFQYGSARVLNIICYIANPFTYDHRHQKTGHPVRSAIHKLVIGRLVVGSVTTSESLLLYVFAFLPSKSSTASNHILLICRNYIPASRF